MRECCKCRKCYKKCNHHRCIKPGPCKRDCDHHQCKNNKPSDKDVNQCKGCICNRLKNLRTPTEVDVFLLGGQVFEDVVFISFDRKNGCAIFNDPTTEPGSTLIVDCQEIQALRLEVE